MAEFLLREACDQCQSSKRAVRKKAVSNLLEYMNRPEIQHDLNDSSISINWNTVFTSAHNALLLESDCWKDDDVKGGSSAVIANRESSKIYFGGLADTVLKKANASKPRISCDHIINACFRIYSDHYLMKNFGGVHIKMMLESVLPVRKYRTSLKCEQWNKLFDHILDFLMDDKEDWLMHSAICLLNSVVDYGCQQSYLSVQVKSKLLPLLEAKFFTFHAKPALQEVLLSMIWSACVTVAKESRTAVCHLGELILASVINMYDSRHDDSSSRNKIVIDFLLFQVQCHHPKGEREGSGAAYACDWKTWNRHMYAMYRIVFSAVSRRQKIKDFQPFSCSFLQLYVELCNQLFDRAKSAHEMSLNMNETNDTDDGPAPKRRKCVIGMEQLLGELDSCKRDAASWPLIVLVLQILQTYPILFQSDELYSLLELLFEMQCICRNQKTMSYICRCFEHLLAVMVKRKLTLDLWLKVWESTLRTVGLNQTESYPLLRMLITEKIAPETGHESLLRMYSSSMIQLTSQSLQTLKTCLSFCHLPESSSSVESTRSLLLDWLFSASGDSSSDAPLFAQVLVTLIVKVKHRPESLESSESQPNNAAQLKETSFESDYCVSAFEDELIIPQNFSSFNCQTQLPIHVSSSLVDPIAQKKLESLMDSKWEELERKCSELQEGSTGTQIAKCAANPLKLKSDLTIEISNHTCVLVNMLSSMVDNGAISDESLSNCRLNDRLMKAMGLLETLLPEVLSIENIIETGILDFHYERTVKILQALGELYERNLVPCVNHHLCEITGTKILVPLVSMLSGISKQLASLNMSPDNSAVTEALKGKSLPFINDQSLSRNDLIHFFCLKILTDYGCLKQELGLHKKQRSVISRIIKVISEEEPYDLSLESTFMMVFHCVSTLLSCEHIDKNEHLRPIIILMQKLCIKWKLDAEASSYILVLLKDIFQHAAKDDMNWEKASSLALFAPYRTKKFGPKFTVKYISAFQELQIVDEDSKWARWSNASDFQLAVDVDNVPREALRKFVGEDGKVAIVEEVILFLLSPFHEVRMASVSVVASLFCGHHHSRQWMQTMFERLTVVLRDMFIVKGDDMKEEEIIDEGANRTATVLHTLSAIIVSSVTCYQRALLLTFQLLKEKNLKLDLIKKVFDLLVKSLRIESIHNFLSRSLASIFHHWLLWGFSIQDFPFRLLSYSSFPDFMKHSKGIVMPVIWKSKDQQHLLNIVCEEIKCSQLDLFEASFPSIYAQHMVFLANSDESSCSQLANIAIKNYLSFESLAGKDKISKLVSTNMHNILIELSNLLWDRHHHEELLKLNFALIEPPALSFCYDSYKTAMKALEGDLRIEQNLLVYLGSEEPFIIQQVLLKLRCNMTNAVTLDQKIKALHSYTAFCHGLATHAASNDIASIEDYLLCDVTHTLLYQIRENETNDTMNDICIGSCRFLHIMYEHLLPAFAPVLKNLLPILVGSLIPLALQSNALAARSLDMLKLLIVTNGQHLRDAISCLPPFPKSPEFEEIDKIHNEFKYGGSTFSLQDELKHFLCSAERTMSLATQNSMFFALNFLRKQLCERKLELSLLYEDLKNSRGFSEDCKDSILHQLICKLISLTSSSDAKVQLEASRCLGELGAADLTTLVLKPAEGCIDLVRGYSSPMMCVLALAAHYLTEYLRDYNVPVVETASQALHTLMNCKGATSLHSEKGASNHIESKKISPFISKRPTQPTPSLTDSRKILDLVCRDEIWCPDQDIQHEEWVVRLACVLLSGLSADDVFSKLASVCKVKTSFAENLLPVLIYLGLSYSSEVCHKLCSCLSKFFEKHCDSSGSLRNSHLPNSSPLASSSIFLNKASVQCMLHIVNFMHLQKSALRDENVHLELNYLHVAEAAQYCSAYSSSVMYLELWCNGESRLVEFDGHSDAYIDFMSEKQPDNGKSLQILLRKAYEQIGDNDAIYGCGSTTLLDPRMRVNQYEFEGKWDRVLFNYNMKLPHAKDMDPANGLLNALQHSGLWYLLNTFIGSLPSDQREQFFPSQLECMWRLGQWNVPLPTTSKVRGFEWCQYSSLRAISNSNSEFVSEFVTEGRLNVLKGLAHSSLENCRNIYKPLAQLQALQEIEDFVNSNDIFDTISKWKSQSTLPYHEFLLLEPILAQRAKLMEINIFCKKIPNSSTDNSKSLLTMLIKHHLITAEIARKEDQTQIAEQSLHSLSEMQNLSVENTRLLRLEEAQLAWESSKGLSGKTNSVACQLLRSLLKELRSSQRVSNAQPKLLAQGLIIYGKWMAEARSEKPQNIIEDYLEEAVQLLEEQASSESTEEQFEAHSCLAHFADLEYRRITAYIKSESFQNKVECMNALRNNAKQANLVKPKDKESLQEQKKAVFISLKYSDLDEGDIKSTYQDQEKYLQLAMRHYITSMKLGEAATSPVFRMVALWLENSSCDSVSYQVISDLDNIQSYKFIVLLPQLAARISNSKDSFAQAAYKLLFRCCVEHPHHTLPLILALANSYEDFEGAVKPEPEPRVVGATQMLSDLRSNKSLREILAEMDKLSKALISLAYAEVPSTNSPAYNVPKNEKIRQIRNFNCAMLPIISLPVMSDAKYPSIIGIQSFETKYVTVGGINKPKKIMCCGSDGIRRPLLVKGKDDLRQDAVMQQVFTIMNKLLMSSQETKRRRLLIRTYKVVPLSQRCGVLQWCENTSPMMDVLTDVHLKYHPNDWKVRVCSKAISDVSSKSNRDKFAKFTEVCQNFHPAFRFFFIEKFPTPAEWFDHRLAYVHSVATNSMVGYILGLGDRHVSNILIDKRTAELIHIDLGIAFEQGKVLPTPETVPFRLTRDIVDGMGVSGVEGVFRRSCEKTMAVLRKNQEKILTVLEVLLYDPLYAWTITPREAAKVQGKDISSDSDSSTQKESNTEKNKMAERILCRLREKLQGTEEGPSSSIEGQVNHLIQQARDPENLSRLFRGWQAYF